jgi:hypothetical protein
MSFVLTRSLDLRCERTASIDETVTWLDRNDVRTFQTCKRSKRANGSRASVTRVAASLAVGAVLTLSAPEAAFAPAASAHSNAQFVRLDDPQMPPVAPVEVAPIMVLAEDDAGVASRFRQLLEGGRTTPESLEADYNYILGKTAAPRATGRDANEVLQFGRVKIQRWLVETILRASDLTGVDPVYMMALADKESSFSLEVKASTSSAEGLFQFITKTWLEVVREFGPKYGLEAEAAAIETADGQATISDSALRERVLNLRRDPFLAAVMAGELLKRDRSRIEQRIGRGLGRSEFYLAHFLGADSAGRFMEALDGKPKQSAPRIFRAAAQANKALFFTRNGRRTKGLSVGEVYSRIDRMIDARLGRYQDVKTVTATTEVASASPEM